MTAAAPDAPADTVAGDAPRWELLRALGALSADPPPASRAVSEALGLACMSRAEHTRVFLLDLPPYASIHLGPEGKLGGEGADRVAGLWRALGLAPPADADHLASLLGLYAELGAAAASCRTAVARRRLDHARAVLLGEHLASWVPGYLAAAAGYPAAAGWARLTRSALRGEIEAARLPPVLPAVLREAPAPAGAAGSPAELLDALVAPLRAGTILTHRDLEGAGAAIGVGIRRGERRFVLRAMLDQDPAATLTWLAGHARRWADTHRRGGPAGPARAWWTGRAEETAAAVERLAAGGHLAG